jgi:hypothetical protein
MIILKGTFPCGNIHMTSRWDEELQALVVIPADEDWQLMFDFMIGW